MPSSRGDELMRKASELFARGKLQKAHAVYGQAREAYLAVADPRLDRQALALYTRALLVLQGDATGDVGADLDGGDRLCADAVFDGALRFAGLFDLLRAMWRRQFDEFEVCGELLDRAVERVEKGGTRRDLHEVYRERMRLAADRKDVEGVLREARQGLDRAVGPEHVVCLKTQVGDFLESIGRIDEAHRWFEDAAGRAFDAEKKELRWQAETRLRRFRELHPESAEGRD